MTSRAVTNRAVTNRALSYRTRVALLTTTAVAVVVLVVITIARVQAATAVLATIDADLRELARVGAETEPGQRGPGATGGRGPGAGPHRDLLGVPELRRLLRGDAALAGAGGITQLLAADGSVLATNPGPPLPVTPGASAVARGEVAVDLTTVVLSGTRVRVLTRPLGDGLTLQVGRPLTEADATLAALTLRLGLAAAFGVVLAGIVGWVVAGRITDPVRRLTGLAEEVSRTQDLSRRLDHAGDDELGRLAAAFDRMLASLEAARRAQDQLIADASHELRTPLTSLRTNVDLLRSGVPLPAADHARLLADLETQLIAFGALIEGLLELARGEGPLPTPGPVDLARLTRAICDQVGRDHPDARIHLDVQPALVSGDETRLGRAVRNLVTNAVVHGRDEVRVGLVTDDQAAVLSVRDHGPGIAPADLPRVLDRFFRAADASARPGCGLGLAIVRQVAETHGGRIAVTNEPDGGVRAVLRLPRAPAELSGSSQARG